MGHQLTSYALTAVRVYLIAAINLTSTATPRDHLQSPEMPFEKIAHRSRLLIAVDLNGTINIAWPAPSKGAVQCV